MSVAEIMADLGRLGIRLKAEGERLRFHPRSTVTPELLHRLRDHKADLLDAMERIEERAAILEFDAGLSRDDAERFAWRDYCA